MIVEVNAALIVDLVDDGRGMQKVGRDAPGKQSEGKAGHPTQLSEQHTPNWRGARTGQRVRGPGQGEI